MAGEGELSRTRKLTIRSHMAHLRHSPLYRIVSAMNSIRALALGAVLFVDGCSPATEFNKWQFERLCHERGGVQAAAPFGFGGVRSDNPNLGYNLWLLFDFGAPFVEFDRRSGDDERLIREWGLPPTAGATWRLERRPAGDDSCGVFNRWLARVSHDEFGYRALPGRWRNAAAFRGQCLSVTFRPIAVAEVDRVAPRYLLHIDAGRIRQWGCDDVRERRYALVDQWGRRSLVINERELVEQRCHVDGPNIPVASCGSPVESDLSNGREWAIDDSTLEGQVRLSTQSN